MKLYIKFFGLFIASTSLILFSNIHAGILYPHKKEIPTLLENCLDVLAQECLSDENPEQFFYETKETLPSDLHDAFEEAVRICAEKIFLKCIKERAKECQISADFTPYDFANIPPEDIPTDIMLESIKT